MHSGQILNEKKTSLHRSATRTSIAGSTNWRTYWVLSCVANSKIHEARKFIGPILQQAIVFTLILPLQQNRMFAKNIFPIRLSLPFIFCYFFVLQPLSDKTTLKMNFFDMIGELATDSSIAKSTQFARKRCFTM